MKKLIPTLGLCLCLAQASMAQLPETYITKVSYFEQKQVSFEMIDESDETVRQALKNGDPYPATPYGRDCLTLGELSRYHSYRQDIQMTKYIDLDGEILSDKRILFEEDVRDSWMPAYSRIILGKELYEVYGADEEVLYRFSRKELANKNSGDSASIDSLDKEDVFYMSAEDAANFQLYVLDDHFYQE